MTEPAAPPDDAAVVGSVLHGDREAFGVLVQRHQNALYRYARSTGLGHDVALDLVQEAFVKAFVRLRQCRDPRRFRSWLFRIFRNAMLDWHKDIRRGEVSLELAGDVAQVDATPERDSADALARALAALPEILREAFLLRHQMDYSYEEIAQLTGASLSAVKMRVMRARDALRAALTTGAGDVTGGERRSS